MKTKPSSIAIHSFDLQINFQVVKNMKLVIFIIFLTLFSYSLLLIADHFAQYQVIMDFITKVLLLGTEKHGSPEYIDLLIEIKKDSRLIMAVQIVFTAAFSLVSIFSKTETIYTSFMTKSGKHLTLKKLLARIQTKWYQALITSLYVIVFVAGYVVLILALLGALMVAIDGEFIRIILGMVVVLMALLFGSYLAIVWNLGLVISVVEEEFCGMEALGKAEEVIKGKKIEGFAINLVFGLVGCSILMILGLKFVTSLLVNTRLFILLLMVNMISLLKILYFIVYTAFYYKCKKKSQEEEEMGLLGSLGNYTRIN